MIICNYIISSSQKTKYWNLLVLFQKPVTLCEESSRVCIRKIAELLKGEAIFGVAKTSHSVWSCIWCYWSLLCCVIQVDFWMNWFCLLWFCSFYQCYFPCFFPWVVMPLLFLLRNGFLNPQGGFRMTCNQSLVLENITEVLPWGENDNFSVTFRVYFLGKRVKFWVVLTYWKKAPKTWRGHFLVPFVDMIFWRKLKTW